MINHNSFIFLVTLVTQINPFYDKIINHLFSCYNYFPLHLESLWTFSNISYFFLIKWIFTQISGESIWSWNPSLTTIHNGLHTSICINSNNLVDRSSLAFERSFNYHVESLTSVTWSNQRLQKSMKMEFFHVLFPI